MARCFVDGCVENAVARELCGRHYQRWYREGEDCGYQPGERMRRPSRGVCATDGCELRCHARGLCKNCYARTRKWPGRKRNREITCEACGKTAWVDRKKTRYCSAACGSRHATRPGGGYIPWNKKTQAVVVYTGQRSATRERRVPVRERGTAPWKSIRCRGCDGWFLSKQFEVACSKACMRDYLRPRRAVHNDRRRARKVNAFVANVYRKKVFDSDGYRCQLCGRKTDPKVVAPHPRAPTIDHIIPLASGGTHEPANCQTACFQCNCVKGDRGGGEQMRLIG